MAERLTPAQVQQIMAAGPNNTVTINGVVYQPVFSEQGSGETLQIGPLEQIVAYDPSKTDPGQQYSMYSPSGDFTGTGEFQKVDSNIAPFLAGSALLFGGLGGLMGNGIFGSIGGGGAGTGSGAWLGEGVASGIPAWDAAALSAGNTLSGVSPALLDAQFIAADAAQLAAQTGNNVAAVQQNLIAAGVDPIVAATAANAAALGMSGSQLITTIAEAGASGAGGLFTGGSAADLALGGITTTPGAPPGSSAPGGVAPSTGSGAGSALQNALTNPQLLQGLLSAALGGFAASGSSGGGSGGQAPVQGLPTQGVPQYTPEYYQAIQNYYNTYLPNNNPNVGSYLADWYGGRFTG